MSGNDLMQTALYLGILLLSVKPLGAYMAAVYEGRTNWAREQWLYRLTGVNARASMTWKTYAGSFLLFNALGLLAVYALLRLQQFLPWNPQHFPAVEPHTAFNIAVSFATNTNWQNYGGETTLSYLTQMAGLAVQNFVSAASGMAVVAALARGIRPRKVDTIGNFWVDLVRSTLYILLPLSILLTVLLVSQGVIQNLSPYLSVAGSRQVLPMGPAASQVAIKQLGTNGGGFFNANSAHPFENPTPLSNFMEMLAILLIPAALCYTFGKMIEDTRQGWAILLAMLLIFLPMLLLCVWSEARGNPALETLGVDPSASDSSPGGNMEGKEVRFGIANSALWAAATTAASNGSVNSMHDSYTPLGGLAAIWLIQLGEVVFGGVGSGLYGMLMFAVVAVFVAGLMVGRTPEYLGKKIEAFEMKMASLVILIPPLLTLAGTAAAVMTEAGRSAVANEGPHGFSEILYAFSSCANNNGSAFAGLSGDRPFYNIALGLAMLIGRYGLIVPVLADAGSLAGKNVVTPGAGTLPTHRPLFVLLLAGVVAIMGALAFLPALALGPIVEQILLRGGRP